ncbi:hypothetical protein SISNIDRAFT_420624 [Sistotremastrum niveocremeum HHB9708]|uniref:Uncharacterized protein n=2 Tax=Sistotremastraceae TaxID=3402574 RepID=A0A164MG73_9AGAM|nr:hypothetical protein SISNIDRAFT_420624 [Sistotremastrum niveocremeum HHB9708]KZT31517.1 hypothetical protein SISSUDRAFT_995021 [Sistotremastrum suecicum HHB10207 ss-3]
MKTWFPHIWASYVELHQDYCKWNPKLHLIAPQCPFTAVSLNIGPYAVCHRHVDFLNTVAGMCLVFVFGEFSAKQSAHLILFEAELLMEAPHGSIIFLPSAALSHGNINLLFGDSRFVLTMYLPGGLFRFRDCGFRTKTEMQASNGSVPPVSRKVWEEGLSRFLTVEEVIHHWEKEKAAVDKLKGSARAPATTRSAGLQAPVSNGVERKKRKRSPRKKRSEPTS